MKLRYLAPIAFFAVLIPILIFGLHRNPGLVPSPLIDRQAPEFELPGLLDPARALSNETFTGGFALFNVWATWCVECRSEHGFLLALAKRNVIPIYGLNWRDRRDLAVRWLDTLGNPYTAVGYDPEDKVGIDWGVYGAPETFLIGPDGTVLHKHVSPLTEEVWQNEFLPLIEAAKNSR